METAAPAYRRWSRTVVSNPLGWDGDGKAPGSRHAIIRVSNPLGWDGDGI